MNLRHLFCRHIYKTIDSEFLRETRERYGFSYWKFQYTAIHQKCIKCNKNRVIEQKLILL